MTDSPLESVSDHCDSGGATLKAGERAEYPKLLKELSQEISSRSNKINVKIDASNAVVSGEVTGVKVTQMTRNSPAERLPEQWNVPPKNNNFIGRRKLLKQLEDHFSQKTTPAILTACHGLGGIGKTQVALEFVWQHYKKYNGVVWFNAESRDRLQNDYISLGRELNIICDDDNINTEERARYVKHWLQHPSRDGWLLVNDNADNYKSIRELLPTKGGKILITSRHTADWPHEISIDVFTIEESSAYVQKVLDTSISERDIIQIETLAETLGRLPLALAQATAYIKRTKMSISRYLELYEQKKRDLLNSKILPSDYSSSVFITWDITMEAIRKESLLAASLLNSCAYLASNDIPNFLLEKFANNPENNPNSEIFEEALGTLNFYSMLAINEQNRSSSMHRLVQEVIRLKWRDENKNNLMDIFNLLIVSFPYYRKTLADYAKKRQLLPHLEAFLTHLDAWQQEEHLLEKDREKGYLLHLLIYIADGYRSIGNSEKERELLERALPIAKRHYGLAHPNVAIILANLGKAYMKLGDTHKSWKFLKRALIIAEINYSFDGPEVASTLTNLGELYRTLGDIQKSRESLERALEINERHYGPDHSNVAATLTNLGELYRTLGNIQESRESLERALKINERHYGPDHPEVAATLTNLGELYRALGNTQESRESLERALKINERHYGPDHPNVAATLLNLGELYRTLGNIQESRESLKRALEINERHYGPDHPEVAATLTNLGELYRTLGNTQESRESLERALAINERYYGLNHPKVAITLTNLGYAYVDLGDVKKFREVLERALEINERHDGSDYTEKAATLTNLGELYRTSGNTQESRESLERILKINERHYGPDHPEVAATLTNLAELYRTSGNTQESRESLERALAINERYYGLNHPKVEIILTNLGELYRTLGNTQESRESLERALAINERYYGLNHPKVAITLTNLGELYRKLGNIQESRESLERALAINERYYGPNHPEVAATLTKLGYAYVDLGDVQKFRELLERALAIYERHYGLDHPEVDTQKQREYNFCGIIWSEKELFPICPKLF